MHALKGLFFILLFLSTGPSAFSASATAVSPTCVIYAAWGHPSVESAIASLKRACGYDCTIASTNSSSSSAIAIASGAIPYGSRSATRFNCVLGLSTTDSTFAADAAREAINQCTFNGGVHCSAMWGPYHH